MHPTYANALGPRHAGGIDPIHRDVGHLENSGERCLSRKHICTPRLAAHARIIRPPPGKSGTLQQNARPVFSEFSLFFASDRSWRDLKMQSKAAEQSRPGDYNMPI